VTYTTEVFAAVLPEKNEPAGKPRTVVEFGMIGTAPAAIDAALALAVVSSTPTPSKTSSDPAFTMRYWYAGRVVGAEDTACAEVGTTTAAIKDTVVPKGLNGRAAAGIGFS
jgi:hypothetical protein